MTLQEIKQSAVRKALIDAISSAHETQSDCVDKLERMDAYNRNRYGADWIKKFEEAQRTIDEAFCELFNPKDTVA